MFMHAPRQKLENPPKEWGKLRYMKAWYLG